MRRRGQDQVRQWSQGQLELLFILPDAHWFYEDFKRLNRTLRPEGISASGLDNDLDRDVHAISDDGDEEMKKGKIRKKWSGFGSAGKNRDHRRMSSRGVQPAGLCIAIQTIERLYTKLSSTLGYPSVGRLLAVDDDCTKVIATSHTPSSLQYQLQQCSYGHSHT